MTRLTISRIAPLFIVGGVPATLSFYRDTYLEVPDPDALAAEFASRGVCFYSASRGGR